MSAAIQPSIGNPFRVLWSLGYRHLVPIIPVDAALHPRTHIRPQSRGKAPGKLWDEQARQWGGIADWQTRDTTEDDIDAWSGMGAGCGLRLGLQHDGTYLHAIDADTLLELCAQIVRETVQRIFGLVPCRIGRAPKALYLIRTSAPLPYRVLTFDGGAVEVLGAGKQCVMNGDHPFTRKPYHMVSALPALADLHVYETGEIDRCLAELRTMLPAAAAISGGSGDRSGIEQSRLVGDPDTVARAMAVLPNRYGTAAGYGYDEWVKIACALRAALPEDYGLGLELFEDYTARGAVTDASESAPRVFGSVQPPFGVGASWLYEIAADRGDGSFTAADPWFDAGLAAQCVENDGGGGSDPSGFLGGSTASDDVFEMLSIDEIMQRPDPRFMIGRHIPEHSVGFLYGDPGTGKSFVALDWALHLAFGRPDWHGDAIEADTEACVVYLAGEGAQGMKTRVRAWAKRHGVSDAQLADGRFRLIPVGVNMMQPEQVVKLARTIRRGVGKACLVVTDTVSRSMPGADENTQKEMTLFVKACDVLRDTFKCVVLGVHHANKGGEMRGSTVLLGAGDFVFKLERAKGAPVGQLLCEKQKDAPDGWSEPYRFDVVDIEGGSSLVPMRCATPEGPEVALTPDVASAVLAAMGAAWGAGEPWGVTYHAGERHAPRKMVRDFGLSIERAEDMLKLWLGMGTVVVEELSAKSKKKGYRVVTYTPETSVFD